MSFLLLLFTVFLGLLIIVLFYFARFWLKRKVSESVPIERKIAFIKKICPPCHSKGWSIIGIDNGLRIWEKDVGSLIHHWYTGETVFGCSCVIPAGLKDILYALQDLRYIPDWDPCVQGVGRVSIAEESDVVSGIPVTTGLVDHAIIKILQMYGCDINTIYSRHWQHNNNREGWFFTSSVQQTFLTTGFLWCGVLIKPVIHELSESPHCRVYMITAPTAYFPSLDDLKLFTSARLAGLKDFFDNKHVDKVLESPSPNGHVVRSSSENETDEVIAKETQLLSEETGEEDSDQFFIDGEYESEPIGGKEKVPLELTISEMQRVCMEAYDASVGSGGWSFLANVKDVDITKRTAQPGEPPWDTLKGVVIVNVPVHYALAYGFIMDYRGEWDDLFARGEIVKEYNPLTKVLRTEFKAVWPTSGRDFTNLVALREVEDGLYCIAGASVGDCPECPPKKGLVRGDLLSMGFFVKEISSDPPCCQITYISRADLKGNLPPRLVNRVTQSQPQGLAILRDRLEALYNQDKEQGPDSEHVSEIQKQGVDIWVELMKIREMKESGLQDVPVTRTPKQSPGIRKRLVKSQQDSQDSQSTADEKSFKEESLIKDEKEEKLLEESGPTVSEENMNLPFVNINQVDYKTLGNQAAATVLGEVVLASKAEIGSENLSDPSKTKGEWVYQSIEKDVVILRKVSPGEKIHSFLGKGLIKCPPSAVWDAVRNHMTRHVYDKMLKKTKIIREIDEHTRLEYLHFEAAQCFLKQARDFLLLTTERIEPERYAVAGVSVDAPECPPVKDLVRGKVYGSGWVIEPVRQDGRLYSMVSYLSQVDFGGSIPVRLLNYVARRQPLCIAYLREYLEKFKEPE